MPISSMSSNSTSVDPFYIHVPQGTKIAVAFYLSTFFIIGLPGNSLVIMVHRKIKDKCVTDWMIFYIAVCDILALLNVPMFLCQLFGIWATGFPNILCKFHFINSNSVSVSSFLFCAFTALERFHKVVLSKEVFSLKLARFIWIPVYLLSFGIGSIVFEALGNNENGHCMYDNDVRYLSTIEYVLVTLVALVCSFIMAICYIRIGFFLIRKMKEITRSGNKESFMKSYKNTIQTTKILAIVTIVFFFSATIPYVTAILISLHLAEKEPAKSVVFFLNGLFYVNTFFNPLLYMGMSAIFRRRSLAVIRSCCGGTHDDVEKISSKGQEETVNE